MKAAWLRDGAAVSERLDFNLKDAQGNALLYAAQEELLSTLGRFVDERLSGEPDWLRAAIHFRLRGTIDEACVFTTWAKARGFEPSSDRIILRGGPELTLLRGVTAATDWGAKFILRAFGLAAVAIFSRLRPRGGRPPEGGIWVEYADRLAFDHAFWRRGLSEPKPPQIYYLDRPDTPPTAERLAAVTRDGFAAFDLRGYRTFSWAALGPSRILTEARASLRVRPLWLAAVVFECRLWRAAYEALYRRFDVRALIQHQDRGWKQAAQADAVEKAGGIMVGYNWSHVQFHLKDWYLTRQHVYFVWGRIGRQVLLDKGHSCRHLLPSGLWLDETGEAPEAYAGLRARCRYVLCLFDSTVAWGMWQTPATLSRFYDASFGLLERHPDWGAAIKCKHADFTDYRAELPGGPALLERARALIDAGRLAVLPPATSPIDAGRAADLSFCYPLNSAGIAASLRGARAVHWDSTGLKDYFLYKAPGQKVIFSELADAAAAIEAAGAGDRSVGDISRWLKDFDHFQDSGAADRVGRFFTDYLAARERLGDPVGAADEAATRYRRAYCSDW